ncbi:MAG: hypothetical protein ACI4XA_07445 [Oscillospiraceae bacterium]
MKNKIIAAAVLICGVISLCGCHSHEYSEATCTQPKTCIGCGETEGEALPHSFSLATCTKPKTCKKCGATEGEILPHFFKEATCTKPKTCTKCGLTEGSATGHSVSIGTCPECGTILKADVLLDIEFQLNMSSQFMDMAINAINTTDQSNLSTVYMDFMIAWAHFENVKADLRDASYICKDYPDLSTLKAKIDKAESADLSKPESKDIDDLNAFLKRANKFKDLYDDALKEFAGL